MKINGDEKFRDIVPLKCSPHSESRAATRKSSATTLQISTATIKSSAATLISSTVTLQSIRGILRKSDVHIENGLSSSGGAGINIIHLVVNTTRECAC